MPTADRSPALSRLLGIVLAMVWGSGLLLISLASFRPRAVEERLERPTKKSASGAFAASSGAGEPMLSVSPLPGGGLPIKPAEPSIDRIAARTGGPGSSLGVEPRRLSNNALEHALVDRPGPPSGASDSPTANRPFRLSSQSGSSTKSLTELAASDSVVRAELLRDDDRGSSAWGRLELREVMRMLNASRPALATAAEEELRRRGISGPLVDLARLAGDADPAVRRAFVESLPKLMGVDAGPWLFELSYDDDPRVRSAAITLMATSGDLELLKRVKQVALDDPDDRTRRKPKRRCPTNPSRGAESLLRSARGLLRRTRF